ncbi:MAG: hypothetical protein M1833_005170 [Piccolia ochrophora]|nr:MAG: hypothetical protein M1833_005170 [Piccolia ochrophora]
MTDSSAKPVSVLFVCLGNICRSPLAEGVFRHLTRSNPSIGTVDSCATGAYHTDEEPDERTMAKLEENGIVDYEHAARQIEKADFTRFDYIFGMDRYNIRDLQRMRRSIAGKRGVNEEELAKVMLFGDFGGTEGEEVIDPYYGAVDGFEVGFEQMVRFTQGFLKKVLPTGEQAGS